MNALTDLHCHLLPGIDDGAQTLDDTAALLDAAVEQGVSEFVFTPHFYPERTDVQTFLRERESALGRTAPLLEARGIRWRVGAEIRITPFLAELPLEELAFSGTRYLLLELDFDHEPFDVRGVILRLRDKGYTPILAHVERYPYVEQDPELLYEWVKVGALAQMNAGAILHDGKAKKRLEQYARRNLVHVLASDAHSMERRAPNLAEGYRALPADLAERLQENAQCIFAGEPIERRTPERAKRRFGLWA